jgi:hypothetical protein
MPLRQATWGYESSRDMETPLHGKLGGRAAAMMFKLLSWTPCARVAWIVLFKSRGLVVLATCAPRFGRDPWARRRKPDAGKGHIGEINACVPRRHAFNTMQPGTALGETSVPSSRGRRHRTLWALLLCFSDITCTMFVAFPWQREPKARGGA